MSGGTVRFRSTAPRMPTRKRKYVLPGEVPSLPMHDYAQTNPGLYSAPSVDLTAMDAQMAAAQADEPQRRLENLGKLKDASSMALASPDVAAEVQGVAEGLGLPATGAAIGKMKRSLPGAPAMPGGSSLPEDDGLAEALATVIGQGAESAPFDDKLVSAGWKGLMDARLEAHKKAMVTQAEYSAKTRLEPALIEAERGQKRKEFELDTPGLIARARGTTRASQEEQTAGYGTRLDRETTELEERIPIKARAAGKEQAAREGEITQGTIDRKRKGYQQDLSFKPMIRGAEERAKNTPLKQREQDRADVRTASLDKELTARLEAFTKKLAASTEAMGERKKRFGSTGGKGAKGSGKIEEIAVQEALQFVSKVEDADLPSGMDRKTFVSKIVQYYLEAASAAKMDPTARAIVERFRAK